ncbi:hypothetical protein DPMN_011702 [Dreissena polymorpha]|uniref:MAM domain-containing protein n=1 Tax=Dreissena polymorpha TaxID=45954 RepID=A0A9D4S0A1_DREPO|nr:hypothetical protein DPMN_011702 [Dreissena polymorpha]
MDVFSAGTTSGGCTFEDPNICQFIQDTTDDFDWTRKSGPTTTQQTGPPNDHTLGTSQGKYDYGHCFSVCALAFL